MRLLTATGHVGRDLWGNDNARCRIRVSRFRATTRPAGKVCPDKVCLELAVQHARQAPALIEKVRRSRHNMNRRPILTIALLAGSAVLAMFAAIAVPLMMVGTVFDPGPPAPTDAAMIAHWQKHRPTLDQITEMLRADPALNRLGMNWSDPADPDRAYVGPERLSKYRELMKDASIISLGRGHRSIHFLFHASGLSVSGFGKSFVRGEASPNAEIVDSDLDAAASGRSKTFLQRPIADGWWLQRDGS